MHAYDPARLALRRALTRCFELIQVDYDAPPARLDEVQATWLILEIAWEACPEATTYYRQVVDDWQRDRGRDPLTGRPLGVPTGA